MTFRCGFCLVLYGIGFSSVGVLTHFFLLFGSDSGSVLGKTWVLIWLFFDGFWFFPVSSHKTGQWVTYVVD